MLIGKMSLTSAAVLIAGSAFAQDIPQAYLDAAAEAAPLGWASHEGTTTGGSAATEPVVVSTRAELVAALGGDNSTNAANDTPALIFISGEIDLTENDTGAPQDAAAFADPEYDLDAYIAAFDPEVYGMEAEPEGALEEARERSEQAQKAHTIIRVGSNKSLIGLDGAVIRNGTLLLKNVENIIIRNIAFEDAYDFFPQWDGTDGSKGNWNAEYDNISIETATRIWIDHCSFSDGARHDDHTPPVFGRVKQHHDGLVDIKNQANYVTLSWNKFFDHDKVHIIGSSDSRTDDLNHLKVTIANNWYDNVKQRTPRARYGEIHVFNNLFTPRAEGTYSFSYAIGVGKESRVLSEANLFDLPADLEAAKILRHYKGEMVQDQGSLVNGEKLDLVGLHNEAVPEKALAAEVDWTPPYPYNLADPAKIGTDIRAKAGAGNMLN